MTVLLCVLDIIVKFSPWSLVIEGQVLVNFTVPQTDNLNHEQLTVTARCIRICIPWTTRSWDVRRQDGQHSFTLRYSVKTVRQIVNSFTAC